MSVECKLDVREGLRILHFGQRGRHWGRTETGTHRYPSRLAPLHHHGMRPQAAELTETIMRRVFVVAASTLALAACADMPKMPDFSMPNMGSTFSTPPVTTTLEFESEPSGAEVRTSTGQTCRTPCSLSVAAADFSATFSAPGYQPQSVPVRMIASDEGIDPMTGQTPRPRLSPNPVYAELVAAPRRPAPATANPAARQKPKATAKPKPKPAASAEPMTATPSAQPSSPWPTPAPAR